MPANTPRAPLAVTLASALASALAVALAVAVGALLASGCTATNAENIPILPAPSGPPDTADPGLGPGVRPLSSGPGDKGSPRLSPSGDRVAFILDSYVAEKPLYSQSFGRRTEDGFIAGGVEWISEDNLAVLGQETAGEIAADNLGSLFLTRPGDAPGIPPLLLEAVEGVEAADTLPNGGLVAAVEAPRDEGNSVLALVRRKVRFYPGIVPGRVVGLTVSPDGSEAALAVRHDEAGGEAANRVELLLYSFAEGSARRVALLAGGQEVLGTPQWTGGGVHFVAGEEGGPYALYRATKGSEAPEPVRGVGEGFLPAGIEASPDGRRLAIVGRRNTSSPADLYVLDLESGTLDAVTANEDMEFKTGPRDLAWSPDGSGVVLVARGALSEPEVYDAPARSLAPAFYNLYLAPAEPSDERSDEESGPR